MILLEKNSAVATLTLNRPERHNSLVPEASFAPFYSDVGPSPDGGWAVLLPLLIGQKRAAEVLYLNMTIDAETAVVEITRLRPDKQLVNLHAQCSNASGNIV